MRCPKCKGEMCLRVTVRPSEVYRLGPDYFGARRAHEYYTENLYTCGNCGYHEVQWYYSDKSARMATR